jgi:hypothetical protein
MEDLRYNLHNAASYLSIFCRCIYTQAYIGAAVKEVTAKVTFPPAKKSYTIIIKSYLKHITSLVPRPYIDVTLNTLPALLSPPRRRCTSSR